MASVTSTPRETRFQREIERVCASSLDEPALLRELAARLRAAIPCTGLLFLRTDPTTVLPTDGVVDGLPSALCKDFWDNELLEDDVNSFVELSRRGTTAATLLGATEGEPSRSRRYTAIYRPLGLGDELRVSFTARDGSCWAIAALVRDEGSRFTAGELEQVESVSPIVADGLRAAFTEQPPMRTEHAAPALLVLDEAGEVAASTGEAEHWLAELVRSSATGMAPVPEPVYLVAGRARAARAGLGDEPAWAQVRTSAGVWLHLHASLLHGRDPLGGDVAVLISPASAPDLAPLVALAYRLTPREQEVLQFLARGLTTAEMAQRLEISTHTVRDHIKSLFQKVGVRSRAELVARIFADHYFDRFASETDPLPQARLAPGAAIGPRGAELPR